MMEAIPGAGPRVDPPDGPPEPRVLSVVCVWCGGDAEWRGEYRGASRLDWCEEAYGYECRECGETTWLSPSVLRWHERQESGNG